MGEWARQAGTELRKLPLILGKVLGGFAAVIGIAVAVLLMTRPPGATAVAILSPLLASGAGIVVFVLCGRALARRETRTERKPQGAGRVRMNVLSWTLLLLLAGALLAVSLFLGR